MTPDQEWAAELEGEVDLTGVSDVRSLLPLVPSRSDVKGMLEAPQLSALQRLALRTLSRSGVRGAELLTLLLQEDGSLTVGGDRQRQVAVDPATFQALRELAAGGGEPLFGVNPEELGRWVTDAARAVGLLARFQGCGRAPTARLLRHAYATHRLDAGMDLLTLSGLLGHEHLYATEMYLGTAVGRYREAYARCHPLMQPDPWALSLGAETCHWLVSDDDEEVDRSHPQANLSVHEVGSLIAAGRHPAGRLLMRVLYATAIRRKEVVDLRNLDLEPTEGRLFVRQGKDSLDRYTLLDPETVRLLQAFRGTRPPEESMFGKSIQAVDRLVETAAKDCGLWDKAHALGRAVSPHVLRHAYASHCYQRGMHPYCIQHLLGHAFLKNTLIYVDCSADIQASQYARAHELAISP